MADKQTTIIEKSEDQPPQPPSDRTLDMAVEFGQLRAEYQNTSRELMEVKAGQSQTLALIQSQNELIQSLRSQADSNAQQTARVAEAQAATVAVVADALEEKEDETGVMEVIPPMETRIEIEQKPVTERSWIQKMCYGRGR